MVRPRSIISSKLPGDDDACPGGPLWIAGGKDYEMRTLSSIASQTSPHFQLPEQFDKYPGLGLTHRASSLISGGFTMHPRLRTASLEGDGPNCALEAPCLLISAKSRYLFSVLTLVPQSSPNLFLSLVDLICCLRSLFTAHTTISTGFALYSTLETLKT